MGNCSPLRLENYRDQTATSTMRFDVYNVDARLFKHSKGQLIITPTHLILHQRSLATTTDNNNNNNSEQQIIQWPLNGVRRYGYYKDIFLFESGRKCPTGEGLFAFKCGKSKRLNDTLHKVILNNATSLYNLQNSGTTSDAAAIAVSTGGHTTIADISSPGALSIVPAPALRPVKETRAAANEDLIYHTPVTEDYAILANGDGGGLNGSPYYVNDLTSLIRLPLSLSNLSGATVNGTSAAVTGHMTSSATTSSTMTAGSGQTTMTKNDYMNVNQIDPSLLHLAQQLNGGVAGSSNTPNATSTSGKLRSLFSSPGGGNYFKPSSFLPKATTKQLVHSSSSSLNYVVPERVKSSLKQKNEVVKGERVILDVSGNNNEYCVMDPKKTTATGKTSSDVSKQRRLELLAQQSRLT